MIKLTFPSCSSMASQNRPSSILALSSVLTQRISSSTSGPEILKFLSWSHSITRVIRSCPALRRMISYRFAFIKFLNYTSVTNYYKRETGTNNSIQHYNISTMTYLHLTLEFLIRTHKLQKVLNICSLASGYIIQPAFYVSRSNN